MSETRYDIFFQGAILDGFSLEQVKKNLKAQFAASEERIESLFRGTRVKLKRNIDTAEVKRYKRALTRAGAEVIVEPVAPPAGRKASAAPARTRTPAAPTAEQDDVRVIPFRFSGEGAEYFRVWIVNILLTIVTLGIYSAWAKVRNKRYFYGNTTLDGASFDYSADPVKILKGRLIAVAFFIVYVVVAELNPLVGLLMFGVLLVLMPWIIVRSLAFNAHYSAYRNVRFSFDGKVMDAAGCFIGWPILALLTLGILTPLVYQKQQRFMVENHRYGTEPLTFNGAVRDYYFLFLGAMGLFIGVLLLGVLAGQLVSILSLVFMIGAYLAAFAYFSMQRMNLLYNNSALGDHGFEANLKLGSYAWLMFTNTLGILLTLGLFIPWARVRTARYKVQHIAFVCAGDMDGIVAAQQGKVDALGQEVGDIFNFDVGL